MTSGARVSQISEPDGGEALRGRHAKIIRLRKRVKNRGSAVSRSSIFISPARARSSRSVASTARMATATCFFQTSDISEQVGSDAHDPPASETLRSGRCHAGLIPGRTSPRRVIGQAGHDRVVALTALRPMCRARQRAPSCSALELVGLRPNETSTLQAAPRQKSDLHLSGSRGLSFHITARRSGPVRVLSARSPSLPCNWGNCPMPERLAPQ